MDFLRKIAASSPLPAGGAAVAYTLGLAIGLLNNIILLEIHRRADQPESEMIMGSINGSAHVMRANLQGLKSSQKKNNFLEKLANLQADHQQQYRDILEKLLPEPR